MDGSKGVSHFAGFSLPNGGSFSNGIRRKSRRLEFIGDSDTAGWCVDGDDDHEDKWYFENSAEVTMKTKELCFGD